MVQLQMHERVRNFAEQKIWRCLECGKDIHNAKDLYSRRFCSVPCKEKYFEQL
ncbi:hypothetical protein KKE06_00645 [Candidatus Micrarchaeota archaeon]|nr:hypothetical protein [Candidatus Micrarchaeota archaeon]MBU1930311.1 hypothetical protein [Candidatus Micrarchaeota archaeon]